MQPYLIVRERSVKNVVPLMVFFVSLFCLVSCHIENCSSNSTVLPHVKYRILVTKELRWDPYPAFRLLLEAGDSFVVEGAEPIYTAGGCLVDQLAPEAIPSQFPDLASCMNGGVSGVYCELIPQTGCGASLVLYFNGKFPIDEFDEPTEITISVQGSTCNGESGRNKYSATATWIGFKTIGDGGVDD